MEEIFDSAHYNVRYDKDTNAAVLVWKEYSEVDDFRTPLMKCADMMRKHESKDFIVDRSEMDHISDKDKHWVNKIFLPALKRSGCERILIVSRDGDMTVPVGYPFDLLTGKYRIKMIPDVESGLDLIRMEKTGGVSEAVLNMTREEALAYMELPSDASWEDIDTKFWQLTKQYRKVHGEEAEEKLNELSKVYEIATGKRDREAEEAKIREGKKKYWGKTADEWKNYFYYTWYKYVIAIVVAVIALDLLYTVFLKPGNDVRVISVGHFVCEGTYFEDMSEECGYKYPYTLEVNVAIPNDEGHQSDQYAEQAAAAALMAEPNIIVTDSRTYPYYFGNMVDISDYYAELENELPPEIYEQITPVYCSERHFQELAGGFSDRETDVEEYSDEEIMVGLMIEDSDFIVSMGYSCLWPEGDTLVFSFGGGELKDEEGTRNLLTAVFLDMGD